MSRFLVLSALTLATWVQGAEPCLAYQPMPKPEGRKPEKIAVLIGTNDYTDAALPGLKFCEKDMLKLKAALEPIGFKVILLLGSGTGDQEATRQNILDTLVNDAETNKKYAFRNVIAPDDLALVAFSGHGQQILVKVKDKELEVPFYCPKRGKSGVPETLVSLNDVLGKLNDGKAKSLMLVDACREYTERREPDGQKSAKGLSLDRSVINGLRKNVGGMFACDDRQRALESEIAGGGHGLFFFSVLEALRTTPRDDDGVVTWEDLVPRIRKQVTTLTAKVPNLREEERQKPQSFGNFNVSVVLVPKSATQSTTMKELGTQSPGSGGGEIRPPEIVDPPTGKAPPALTSLTFTSDEAKKAQERWAKHLGLKIQEQLVLPNKATLTLVLIPPGKLMMGSPQADKFARVDDKPEREVTISKPFYLGLKEVSQEEYVAIAKVNPSTFDGKRANRAQNENTSRFPVDSVDVIDAESYCKAVGELLRKQGGPWKAASGGLPTEAQFEWACRAGTNTDYNGPKLELIANVKAVGNGIKAYDRTAICGERAANAFGLFDMHGNVAEWCRDTYDPACYKNSPDKVTDPLQDSKLFDERVLRGGAWNSDGRECRSASRRSAKPESRSDDIGFRVCITIAP